MFIRRRLAKSWIHFRGAVKYSIAVALLAVLYCEWFAYSVRPLFWPLLQCEDKEICTKIMFIADPQIQGEYAAAPPLNWIYAWDSDRYLRNTFYVAANKFKPQVMVYLGDLMDEGSISTMPQFYGYAKRLYNIFGTTIQQLFDHDNITQVWIPGDNDIGGENEPIKRDKVREFEKIYQQPPIVKRGNLSFYKVNAITHEFPRLIDTIIDTEASGKDEYKIVVSHYSVTERHVFGSQVDTEIKPNIYFCAHDHVSMYKKRNFQSSDRATTSLSDEVLTVPYRAAADVDVVEIFVPTCSYRMGTQDIGYGVAVLDHKTKELKYTVLWSPRRFSYLFLYLAVLATAVAYCLVYCSSKLLKCLFRKTPKAWSNDTVPLIT